MHAKEKTSFLLFRKSEKAETTSEKTEGSFHVVSNTSMLPPEGFVSLCNCDQGSSYDLWFLKFQGPKNLSK